MKDITGELCPTCKKGKLRPAGKRELKEAVRAPVGGEAQRELAEYECDTCGNRCNELAYQGIEAIEAAEKETRKIKKKVRR